MRLECLWGVAFSFVLLSRAAFGDTAMPLNPANVKLRMQQALKYLDDTQLKSDRLTDDLRLKGEWPSYVRGSILPDPQVSAIYDSNAFVPMFVAYPMFWLNDADLPAPARRVRAMKQNMMDMLTDRAKNGYLSATGELNFWPTFQGFHGPQQIFHVLPFTRLLGPIFDIANDADDTSVFYMTTQKFTRDVGTPVRNVRTDFENIFTSFLDRGRARSDKREEKWKPPATGAFLTWLSNEDVPGNRQPIAFQLPNNVDCIVMANVLYAMGLKGATRVPGYEDSCRLAREVIAKQQYPICAFYYPPQWLYPYVISRSYRDGGNECLAGTATTTTGSTVNALDALVDQILAAREKEGTQTFWTDHGKFADLNDDRATREPGFRGGPRVYSTALAVITLMNLGPRWVRDAQKAPKVRGAIQEGITYLLNNVTQEEKNLFWEGGVFFSSSYQEVARWKSRPYTTAMALEALLKYRLNYAEAASSAAPLRLQREDVPAEWTR